MTEFPSCWAKLYFDSSLLLHAFCIAIVSRLAIWWTMQLTSCSGPQLGWRLVYVIEYIGPLLIHPLLFQLRPYIYRNPTPSATFPPASAVQSLSLLLVSLHFLKREFETIFVHKFTAATMPARNVIKNSAHYWGLSGLLIAYFTYAPTAPAAGDVAPWITLTGLALFVLGEVGNGYTHAVFRGLRSRDGQDRGIPRGIGFDWVTSPNYMFECVAWVGLCLVTISWSTVVFTVVAAVQMAAWAKQREKRYRKTFGDKYKKKRYALIPGLY